MNLKEANRRTIYVIPPTEASLLADSDSGPKYGLSVFKKNKTKQKTKNPTKQKSLFKPMKLTGALWLGINTTPVDEF